MFTHYEECPIDGIVSLQSLFTFSRRTFPKDYRFNGESHDFTEVVCVIGGRAGVTADKNVYVLSAGQLIVHRPNEFHKIWSDNEEAETVIFSFRANAFPALEKSVFALNAEQLSKLCEIHKKSRQVFSTEDERVTGILPQRKAEAAMIVKQLEILLLSVFVAENGETPCYGSQGAQNYRRIVNAMEEMLGAPLNVSELARRCNLSVSAVEKTMHRFTGCGAIAYFNNLRMKRAAALLQEGKSVKEVSAELGFSCQNYFSSAFKKWSNQSPSAFRKR